MFVIIKMFESRFSLFEKLLKKALVFFNLLELKSGKYSHYYITNSTAFTNNLLISFKFLSSKNLKQRHGCKQSLAANVDWLVRFDHNSIEYIWLTIMNGYVYFMSHHRRKTTQTKWMASIPWKKKCQCDQQNKNTHKPN